MEVVGAVDQIRESDTELLGWGVEAEYNGRIGSVFSMEPSLGVGQTIDYELLTPALTIQTGLEFTLRPIPALRLDTIAQYQHHTPQDASSSEAYLIRTSIFGQFTREIGLRLIAEYSDGTDNDTSLDTSLLFTWLQHPGTAAYIGYSESLIFEDNVASAGRGVFAKVTFQFRP